MVAAEWRAMRNAMKFLEERAGQATHMSRDPRTMHLTVDGASRTKLCCVHNMYFVRESQHKIEWDFKILFCNKIFTGMKL